MYPEIFKLGPFALRSYGLMLIFSVLLGIYYVYKMSRDTEFDFNDLLTITYILVFGGILGARLGYVLMHISEFQGRWMSTINPFGSDQFGIAGLNLYGGVILAVLGSFIYIRLKKLPVLRLFDLFAPTIGIGLFFTRFGCLLNGCCFGTPTDLPWGISFPVDSMPFFIFGAEHLHPSQIYSSLYGLLLFVYLHWCLKNKSFDGQVIGLLFMIESVFRYAIESVRYYEEAMHFAFFGMQPTYNHLISIMLFLLGLTFYLTQYLKHKSAKTADA